MSDETLDTAAERITELAAPEPEAPVEIEPVPEQEAPVDNVMQTQQQLANYQHQLSQEQAAIHAEENEIKSLRQSDPAEYSARTMDLMTKKEQLTYKAAQFEHVVSQFDNQQASRITQEQQKNIQNGKAYLERTVGWNDEKANKVVSYLRNKGMTDSQIRQIPDAQTIESHYRAMMSQKPKKTLPKKPVSVDHRARAESEITRRNLGSGSTQAAAARIEALMFK